MPPSSRAAASTCPSGGNHLPSAEGHSGVSHKNRRFQTGFGLPLSSQKPGPNAETEQGNGDNCERERRQPARHVAHIEAPDDRCNHRCDCHTKKDSKRQIWLPAPGHAPQNQEQQETGYLQQCCHVRTRPRRAAGRWAVSASCPGTDGSRYNRSPSSLHAWQPRAPIRGSRDRVPPRLPDELAEESRSHVRSRSHHAEAR